VGVLVVVEDAVLEDVLVGVFVKVLVIAGVKVAVLVAV